MMRLPTGGQRREKAALNPHSANFKQQPNDRTGLNSKNFSATEKRLKTFLLLTLARPREMRRRKVFKRFFC
jgi:hypothetical protein